MPLLNSYLPACVCADGMTVTKRKLLATIVAAAVSLLCRVPAAQASAIQLNDFSDMSAGGTLVPFPGGDPANPLTIPGGVTLTFSTAELGGLFSFDDGSLFAFPPGMTPVLLNNPGNGPMTIEFSPGIQEFGFLAQNVAVGEANVDIGKLDNELAVGKRGGRGRNEGRIHEVSEYFFRKIERELGEESV